MEKTTQAPQLPQTVQQHLGAELRKYRAGKHLAQRELAERLGVSQTQLSALEHGHSWTLDGLCSTWQRLGRSPAEVFAVCYEKAMRHSDLPLFTGLQGEK